VRYFERLLRHWSLLALLAIYLVLAVTHSLVVPLTAGNDEWAHFLYTRFIAEQGRLPATWAERDQAGYKSDAPPLYHLIVAASTSGVEPERLLRPINSPRRELADNLVEPYALVHTGVELPPYRGEVLLWHLGRGVSILFGLVTVSLTYVTAWLLFSNRRRALTAAALLAFSPAFLFHSSVLSYESLSALFGGLFLLAAIKAIKQPERWRWWLAMGVLAGLSIITKYSAVLLPLELVVVGWLAFRIANVEDKIGLSLSARAMAARLLLAGLALLLAVSWWFGFVLWNFNEVTTQGPVAGLLQPLLVGDASDTTSVNVANLLFGQNLAGAAARPPLERHYSQLLQRLLETFWGAPVNGQFLLSPWLPLLFSLVALFGLASLGGVWRRSDRTARTWLVLLLTHSILIVPLLLIRLLFSYDAREVVQGRHLLLPAASAIPILLVWGWDRWSPNLGRFVAAGLLLWTVLVQIGWASVAYPLPMLVWTANPPPSQPVAQLLVDGSIALVDVAWEKTSDQPVLAVTLRWRALQPVTADYLVELSLEDEAGNLVSYGLGHPVQGRYPTRAWEPGDLINDRHWLPLVDLPAGDYSLELRLLDRDGQPQPEVDPISLGLVTLAAADAQADPCAIWFAGRPDRGGLFAQPYRLRSSLTVISSQQPLLQPGSNQAAFPVQAPLLSAGEFHIFVVGPDWAERYRLVVDPTVCPEIAIEVPPRNFNPPEVANPLKVTFNEEVRLLGYELPSRRIQPGGRLPLTLYWQALDYIGEDYRIFDNLLDREQRRWGGYDRRAQDGYSTLLWAPGEVITDAFGVPVEPDAPPGIYTLDIGLYRQTEAGAESLPVAIDGQPVEQRSLRLGPIKVGGPPPAVIATAPSPQVTLNHSFGDRITLLGYDLTNDGGQPIQNQKSETLAPTLSAGVQNLKLTLYWQAKASPDREYTTFLHLRDSAGQNVTQKDSPPAGGLYPTTLWDAGEIIVDVITLPVSNVPPGDYGLVVGLYDYNTGARLAVDGDPGGELKLQEVVLP
jgi:4-amino-4-deoxy-L-arabinose transferase-like glycosyltransferase